MQRFKSPNERIVGPLPRKDILAVCSFLNRQRDTGSAPEKPEVQLDRVAAAARMQ